MLCYQPLLFTGGVFLDWNTKFKITGELEQLVLLLASTACHAHQTVNTLLTPLIKGVFSKERKGQEVCVCVYGGAGCHLRLGHDAGGGWGDAGRG